MLFHSPKYVGPKETSDSEETPFQARLREYRFYPGKEVGFGGLIAQVKSHGSITCPTDSASPILGVGEGGKDKAFHAPSDGDLQFAVNVIVFDQENLRNARQMLMGIEHQVHCDQNKASEAYVKRDFTHRHCLEASYTYIANNGLNRCKPLSDQELTRLAEEHYRKRLERRESLTDKGNVTVSQRIPDLWCKDNIGGYYFTVKTSDERCKCPI